MAKTVVIDMNSIGHAQHNGVKLTSGEFQTQAIFGSIKALRGIKERNPGAQLLCLWDGKAHWRFDLYPDYKSNRNDPDPKKAAHKEAYKAQIPLLKKALQYMGVKQMLVASAEADDMAGLMVKRLSDAGNGLLLVTGDKDWLQLVRPGVTWHDPIRDNTVNVSNFFDFTGYETPEGFLDGKALMGDNSDVISGVGGIGEKGAPEFIAQFKTVQNFFDKVDAGQFVPKKKAHERLASPEGRAIFERNRKLMNLLEVPVPKSEDINVIKPEFNKERFKTICERLAFQSILRDLDNFVKPFQA